MPETHSHLRGEHKNKAKYKHSSRVPQSDKGLSSIHSTSRNAHSSTGQSISVCRSVLGQTRLPQINQCNFTVLARETGPVAFRQVTAPPRSRGTQRPALLTTQNTPLPLQASCYKADTVPLGCLPHSPTSSQQAVDPEP